MDNDVSRDQNRPAIADLPKFERCEFDALLATLRARRLKKSADRIVPTTPKLEVA
jgi:hypothetical protein